GRIQFENRKVARPDVPPINRFGPGGHEIHIPGSDQMSGIMTKRGPGGSTVYEVSSRNEGIKLAQLFLQQGKYNWFRGQVSNAHFVAPTLLRSTTDRQLASRRLDRFFSWV